MTAVVSAGASGHRLGERRRLALSHGDVAYETAGAGAFLLCVQGVGVVGGGWEPQVQALASRFHVVTIDNRGVGGSALGPLPLTLEAMVSDVLAVADAERAERFHLMGHSMGGLIALGVARRAPQRVSSLSLLCTCANGADATALSLRMLVHGLRSRVGTRAMRRNGMLRMVMPTEFLRGRDRRELADELERLFGRDLADQPPVVGRQLRAMSRCKFAHELGALSGIPTLVVSGSHDPIAPPRLGRAIANRIAGARFVEFPQASHALPIQCADAVNALLVDHLEAADAAAG